MSNPEFVDAVVVGGGMVGASIALALGQAGYSVMLVEEQPIPSLPAATDPFDVRVSALSNASIDFLAQLGVWPILRESRHAPYRRMRVWDQAGAGDVSFHARDTGFPYLGVILENQVIQAGLWQAVAQCPAIRPAQAVQPQHWQAGKAFGTLTLSDGRRVQTSLLIGADGAHSWVRQHIGLEIRRHDYDTAAQVLSVHTAYPQQDITWQRFTPQGPQAFLPLAGARGSLVWYDQPDRVAARQALSDDALLRVVHQAFPPELGEITAIERRASFPIRRLHAARYQAARTVLIGDAAHTIHPLAGQGVNLGFADARALFDCLKDQADLGLAALLMRYERNRRADNLTVQYGMDAFHYGFRETNPLAVRLRNAGLMITEHCPPLRRRLAQFASGER
ncbi:UbiH/UbiF/VisC/COQ6 family ubiquinone biosynthesis hydroxylase [Halothiobacillus sp. DCM-1]|uniref:UbiH/UbiF/VisC/COQ6 family ubiquinone biosynthesis hydroxylase n=1 Tax=Halothiobacillus sp. DCM-1 TaxID=3112558 RepID=UPI00324C63E5